VESLFAEPMKVRLGGTIVNVPVRGRQKAFSSEQIRDAESLPCLKVEIADEPCDEEKGSPA
jgi:hypothetical protein